MGRKKGGKNKSKTRAVAFDGIEILPKENTQKEIVEVIKEIVKFVPEPRLEGFALYKALKDKGFFQGGQGFNMEDPNGTESVYVPHPQEVIGYFIGDPSMWDKMRDGIIRTYLELQ